MIKTCLGSLQTKTIFAKFKPSKFRNFGFGKKTVVQITTKEFLGGFP